MEKYLKAPIKQVIQQFPQVAQVLTGFGVGCVDCSVGSCLLKDVVSIHHLSSEDEVELMFQIEKSIYPERQVQKKQAKSSQPKKVEKTISYSPPVKILVDEHTLIKRGLALIPAVISFINQSEAIDHALIQDIVFFIRNYADKFHHAKEEDILFKYCNEASDIISVMYEDHAVGRNCVKTIIQALENNDRKTIVDNFMRYKELLIQHIKKEDEILYPWIDRGLNTHQVGELFSKFSQVESNYEPGIVNRCQGIIENLEQRFKVNF